MQPILKDILARLAARRLAPTPENFGWACRQAMAERGLKLDRQYGTFAAALAHALDALGDLLVDDAWLDGRVEALRTIIADRSLDEPTQTLKLSEALAVIERGRPEVARRMRAELDTLRAAIAHAVAEVDELSRTVASSHIDLGRYERLALECDSPSQAREIVATLAADMRLLQAKLQAGATSTGAHGRSITRQVGALCSKALPERSVL